MLEHLFKFPIVMVDGNREEQKDRQNELLAIDSREEPEVIRGEAECPYYDFISVADRWLPSDRSFSKAMDGRFDACSVIFLHSGTYVVPWSKEKFKEEISKFAEKAKKEEKDENMKVLKISREELMANFGGALQLTKSNKDDLDEEEGEEEGEE